MVACIAALAGTSGCGNSRAQDVQRTATAFYDALAAQRGADACALLAPPTRSSVEQSEGKPCAQGIGSAGLPSGGTVETVRVYGTMAQVKWSDDVTFLTRYGATWRVVAAGCSIPPPSQRTSDGYDCDIEAG